MPRVVAIENNAAEKVTGATPSGLRIVIAGLECAAKDGVARIVSGAVNVKTTSSSKNPHRAAGSSIAGKVDRIGIATVFLCLGLGDVDKRQEPTKDVDVLQHVDNTERRFNKSLLERSHPRPSRWHIPSTERQRAEQVEQIGHFHSTAAVKIPTHVGV